MSAASYYLNYSSKGVLTHAPEGLAGFSFFSQGALLDLAIVLSKMWYIFQRVCLVLQKHWACGPQIL